MTLPLAFYGTLQSRPGDTFRRFFSDLGRYDEDCLIPGVLYSVGQFPALVPGDGVVEGQLWYPYEGCELEALALFDRIECCHEDDPLSSMYLRRKVRLLIPEVDALVYFWNYGTVRMPRIVSGSWREWEAENGLRLEV